MDKKQILNKLANRVLSRLNAMSYDEVSKEASEWFNDEILLCESKEEIISDYMEDFMRYREAECEGELLEKLKQELYA